MTAYYRVMAGKKSMHAKACFEGGFIGTDFGITENVSADLDGGREAFIKKYGPIYLTSYPDKSKVATGLACSAIYTVSRGIEIGDVILTPDGNHGYRVGEVTSGYSHAPGGPLPHRRSVHWRLKPVPLEAVSSALQASAGSQQTCISLSPHGTEIAQVIGIEGSPDPVDPDGVRIDDPVVFAMEKHLEAFLVANWDKTLLGKSYDIYQDDGDAVGQQYMTSVGTIDILAQSKDKTKLLVVELKRGRASDVVVGQTLRYMGYVQTELADGGQTVEGAIIALEDDKKLRMALVPVPSVTFYRYEVTFTLTSGAPAATAAGQSGGA